MCSNRCNFDDFFSFIFGQYASSSSYGSGDGTAFGAGAGVGGGIGGICLLCIVCGLPILVIIGIFLLIMYCIKSSEGNSSGTPSMASTVMSEVVSTVAQETVKQAGSDIVNTFAQNLSGNLF